jgi:hypothetical protein
MEYNEKELKIKLNSLVGETIKSVFYQTNDEENNMFYNLRDEVIEVPLLGILLETKSNKLYNIINYDYVPYYGLEGILFFYDENLISPNERPNQINESFWNRFKNKKIINISIINSFYKISNKKRVIPLGIKLNFESNEECYIMNLTLESFISDKKKYEISHGGGLVIFSNRKIFEKHINLKSQDFLY